MSAATLDAVIARAIARLRRAGVDSPATDARLLIADALGTDRAGLITQGQRVLSTAESGQIEAAIARRAAREPVGRILGRRDFWGMTFAMAPETLEPRPESETLIEAALARLPERRAPLRLSDLGTGSGCLLLALLSERPEALGVGVDIAPGAARCASANAARLGFASRAMFIVGDWAAPFASNSLDMIVANPPYIPENDLNTLAPEVVLHDPRAALAGGADGLAAYPTIAAGSHRALKPGGWLYCEFGVDQEEAIARIFDNAGFARVTIQRDLAGRPRCISGCKPV